MSRQRAYATFAEFEREEIRPAMRIGWTVDELEESSNHVDFDADPFEAAMIAAEEDLSNDD